MARRIECKHCGAMNKPGTPCRCGGPKSSRSPGCYLSWHDADKELPALGEKVILYANGVVQEEIYTMDVADISDYPTELFWSRDDLEECPKIESGQWWARLPSGPDR